jgi:hypothetical protein
LPKLAIELEKLRLAMKAEATLAEHDVALGAVASAQNAAEKNDGPAVLSYLSNAGEWALGIASKIGAAVAIAAIKSGIGL